MAGSSLCQTCNRWRIKGSPMLPTRKAVSNTPCGEEPSPLDSGFQAAFVAQSKAA
jgi:hypothetical protein